MGWRPVALAEQLARAPHPAAGQGAADRDASRGKATGLDGIAAELLQALSDRGRERFLQLMHRAWGGDVPQPWKDVVLLPLFKKGDRKQCDNYRGISLLSAAGKAFEKVIQLRLQQWAESRNMLPESQQGFRKNRGCTDAIHCLRLAMEAARTGGHELHMAFVDLSKAYDSVARAGLWSLLDRLGVPPKMLDAIKQLHEGAQAMVEVEGRLSEPFPLRTGVKQGSGLSPLLFNIYAAAVFWEWQREHQGDVTHLWNLDGVLTRHHNALRTGKKAATGQQRAQDLQYADDAVIMARTRAVLDALLNGYQKVARRWALDMSVKKTRPWWSGRRGTTSRWRTAGTRRRES